MHSRPPASSKPPQKNEIRRVFVRVNLVAAFGWFLLLAGLLVFSIQHQDGLGYSAGFIAGFLVTGGGIISFFGPLWQIYVKITRFSDGKPD